MSESLTIARRSFALTQAMDVEPLLTKSIPLEEAGLLARLKDSIYGDVADSLAGLKKETPTTPVESHQVHGLALRSIAQDQQTYFLADESELIVSKHFRQQDNLAKKAVDEFHAELVGAVDWQVQ